MSQCRGLTRENRQIGVCDKWETRPEKGGGREELLGWTLFWQETKSRKMGRSQADNFSFFGAAVGPRDLSTSSSVRGAALWLSVGRIW